MLRTLVACLSLGLVVAPAFGQEAEAQPEASQQPSPKPEGAAKSEPATAQTSGQSPGGVKTLSGMSILGNEEAPKSLVIVPWKRSEIGDGLGVSNAVDDRARPVDKEVFMRELHYYELRTRDGS
jgi:hypothetical protein